MPTAQIALADALHLDRAYASTRECGLHNPTEVTLCRSATALHRPFSALFEVPPGGKGPSDAPREQERQNRSVIRGNTQGNSVATKENKKIWISWPNAGVDTHPTCQI
jgi:transcriptional regulator with XRE-family HTH domain